MEQIALYRDFRIRAYQDWSGQWLAEAKRPFNANPEYIATPIPHATPEAAVDLVKKLIDGEGTKAVLKRTPGTKTTQDRRCWPRFVPNFRRTSSIDNSTSPGSANDSPSKNAHFIDGPGWREAAGEPNRGAVVRKKKIAISAVTKPITIKSMTRP
jgi:hypothetical protein